MVDIIEEISESRGRIFFLGVGGGAGHASHAVNDFRQLYGTCWFHIQGFKKMKLNGNL